METAPPPSSPDKSGSFLARNEFLIRRLHSLSGLVPVGAYMCVHLLTNASILNSVPTFQNAVFQIHSLGAVLPIVEWTFIFIPLLFHAIVGVVIVRGGLPNTSSYAYSSNIRYTLQRATGMIAFVFIAWHVFHMHGWFHFDVWLEKVAYPLGGAKFSPYSAASTGGAAIQASLLVQVCYAIGVLSCVFHLANGLWTMGITWGVWISPAAQKRAGVVCTAFGLLLAAVGMSALVGFAKVDVEKAAEKETQMFKARLASGELEDNEQTQHKRAKHKEEKAAKVDK